MEDPVGTDVHKGIAAISAFYEGSFGADARLSLTGPVRCAGNAAAFAFEVHVGGMKIEVIDVFEFDSRRQGRIHEGLLGPGKLLAVAGPSGQAQEGAGYSACRRDSRASFSAQSRFTHCWKPRR